MEKQLTLLSRTLSIIFAIITTVTGGFLIYNYSTLASGATEGSIMLLFQGLATLALPLFRPFHSSRLPSLALDTKQRHLRGNMLWLPILALVGVFFFGNLYLNSPSEVGSIALIGLAIVITSAGTLDAAQMIARYTMYRQEKTKR